MNSGAPWNDRAVAARRAAHDILASYGDGHARVVNLREVAKRLSGAPIDVQDYFNEAVRCLEHGLNRSGIVMAWCGFFYVFSDALFVKHAAEIRAARAKWVFKDVDELRAEHGEAQILEVAKDVKFIGRDIRRVLDGHLSTRNLCAHPTVFDPGLNSALGFVDDMIVRTLRHL